MKSILQDEKECFICGKPYGLHKHHIFGGPNRKHSENNGLWIWLCPPHHNMSDFGIHFDKELDLKVKKMAQEKFEENNDRSDFIEIFGRSWL